MASVDALESRVLLSAVTAEPMTVQVDTVAGQYSVTIDTGASGSAGQTVDIMIQPTGGTAYIMSGYMTSSGSDAIVYTSHGMGNDSFQYLVDDGQGNQVIQLVHVNDASGGYSDPSGDSTGNSSSATGTTDPNGTTAPNGTTDPNGTTGNPTLTYSFTDTTGTITGTVSTTTNANGTTALITLTRVDLDGITTATISSTTDTSGTTTVTWTMTDPTGNTTTGTENVPTENVPVIGPNGFIAPDGTTVDITSPIPDRSFETTVNEMQVIQYRYKQEFHWNGVQDVDSGTSTVGDFYYNEKITIEKEQLSFKTVSYVEPAFIQAWRDMLIAQNSEAVALQSNVLRLQGELAVLEDFLNDWDYQATFYIMQAMQPFGLALIPNYLAAVDIRRSVAQDLAANQSMLAIQKQLINLTAKALATGEGLPHVTAIAPGRETLQTVSGWTGGVLYVQGPNAAGIPLNQLIYGQAGAQPSLNLLPQWIFDFWNNNGGQ